MNKGRANEESNGVESSAGARNAKNTGQEDNTMYRATVAANTAYVILCDLF